MEIDGSWGGVSKWNVSEVDQLAWLAARHGYSSYLKVRCKATHQERDPHRMEPNGSNWYYPLHSPGAAFRPTRYNAVYRNSMVDVQDMVLLDAQQPDLTTLPGVAEVECRNTFATKTMYCMAGAGVKCDATCTYRSSRRKNNACYA